MIKFYVIPVLTAVLLLSRQAAFSQRQPNKIIESSYVDGENGFFGQVGRKLKYPAEARTKGVMGLSVVSFKVDCNNKPHSFIFRHKLWFGIEDEIQKTIENANDWVPCIKRDTADWINLKVAFSINQLHKSKDADLVINAMGSFPGVSDEQLKIDLEKALKKQKNEKAKSALIKLLMRFPYDQQYKEKLQQLLNEKT